MSLHLGVVRVLTQEDYEVTALHGRLIEDRYPSITTTSACIDDHPDGIPDEAAEKAAEPYVAETARSLAPTVDALAISCALDPAVDELQRTLDIPVIGAGRAVINTAQTLGGAIGTLSLEGGVPSYIAGLLGGELHASVSVPGAETTNYLTTDEGRRSIEAAAEQLVDDGCDVIAPICTGMSTAGVLPHIAAEQPVPVIDPVLSIGSVAMVLDSGHGVASPG